MKKKSRGTSLFYALLLFCIIPCISTQTYSQEKKSEAETQAIALLESLKAGHFGEVVTQFDSAMSAQMNAATLQKVWTGLMQQSGPLQTVKGINKQENNGYTTVIQHCVFEKMELNLKLVYNPAGKVAGMFFTPAAAKEPYEDPPYAPAGSFHEEKIEVMHDLYPLPGLLTIPAGKGPFAVVILVHGSGPNDMDETIGPNKIFRDLALGLAAQGIATIRYHKRTFAYGAELQNSSEDLTVEEEVVQDARAAIQLALERKELRHDAVYLLGHSLGAMMAPRIGQNQPDLAGIIMMAGPARKLEDLILEQVHYLGDLSEQGVALQETVARQVQRVKDEETLPDQPTDSLPLGLSAAYWMALNKYDAVAAAGAYKGRMLILQGERDYQVTPEDYRIWQENLNEKPRVKFVLYPGLNHLFMEGRGKSIPQEYQETGHVSKEVIQDIASWIRR